MTTLTTAVTTAEFESNRFPVSHWERLRHFAIGDKRDPRGLFCLTDDMWDTWPYAVNGIPSHARLFRFHFGRFQTFLKLYAKWYCYQLLLGRPGDLRPHFATLPAQLMFADTYISGRGFRSIDELCSSHVFEALWKAQLKEPYGDVTPRPRTAVFTQVATRSFWQRIRIEFSTAFTVPPIAPHIKVKPAEFAADRSKLIPEHVIKRLTNKLALHREQKEILVPFDHLRLCVIMLIICLGRRVNEILLSPRGEGPDGPLSRYPSRSGAPEGALWFHFTPNKRGPADNVFISPEWEDIALYCVRELVKYSDEVRHLATPEEQEQLILVSLANSTKGWHAKSTPLQAYSLTYSNFNAWLNGIERRTGILTRWNITADGTPDGPIYRFLTNYARHTRQSALALDSEISPLARQQDLNHQDLDMQFAYQHRLRENNDALLEKIKEGKLLGRGLEWLSELLGVKTQGASPQTGYKVGGPAPMSPRMQALVINNPKFIQRNRVPCGICTWPQGPGGCAEFLNCTSAEEGGCHYFVVDVSDVQMLNELNEKADDDRQLHLASASAGRVVQAQRRKTLASRTEDLRNEAMRRASEVTLAKLRIIRNKIDEEGL